MWLESLFSSLFGAVVGAGITIISTRKVEEYKNKITLEAQCGLLYTELGDLHVEASESLEQLYDLYAKTVVFEKFGNKAALNDYITPKAPSQIILKPVVEQCFPLLSKPQRDALKSILTLLSSLEVELAALRSRIANNHLDIHSDKVYSMIACFGVIYQVSLLLSEQKERFILIEKTPKELFRDTLAIKGYSLDIDKLAAHVQAI